MTTNDKPITTLIAKDEIRELGLLYSRAIDRKDWPLVRSLYTDDGTDTHGEYFSGTADEFIRYLEDSMAGVRWTGHFIGNHLISVSGDEGEGELYALAYHIVPDGQGGFLEDLMAVRYLDRYRKERGRWRFANRFVSFDMRSIHPASPPISGAAPPPESDPSYEWLRARLFARGTRC